MVLFHIMEVNWQGDPVKCSLQVLKWEDYFQASVQTLALLMIISCIRDLLLAFSHSFRSFLEAGANVSGKHQLLTSTAFHNECCQMQSPCRARRTSSIDSTSLFQRLCLPGQPPVHHRTGLSIPPSHTWKLSFTTCYSPWKGGQI